MTSLWTRSRDSVLGLWHTAMSGWADYHYVFAHSIVPEVFYYDPQRFFDMLEQHGDRFLRTLWTLACGQGLRARLLRFTADELQYEVRRLGDHTTIALVTLPIPVRIAEAYFVAPIYRPSTGDGTPGKGQALEYYFTLEYGLGEGGLPRTVLCAWAKTKSWVPERPSDLLHLNYGDGPEPNLEAFFRAVCSFTD